MGGDREQIDVSARVEMADHGRDGPALKFFQEWKFEDECDGTCHSQGRLTDHGRYELMLSWNDKQHVLHKLACLFRDKGRNMSRSERGSNFEGMIWLWASGKFVQNMFGVGVTGMSSR